jgi:hypothetical protein
MRVLNTHAAQTANLAAVAAGCVRAHGAGDESRFCSCLLLLLLLLLQ